MTLEWFVFPQGPFTLTPECLNDDMVASIKSVCVAYLRWCQETAGNTAFTCHDDSVLGQDANASSGVVDSFDSIFDLYRNIHSSNNKCEKFGAKNRWKVSGTKTSKDNIIRAKFSRTKVLHKDELLRTWWSRPSGEKVVVDESYRLAILTQFNCSDYEITMSTGEIDSVKCVFRRKSRCRRIEKELCSRIRAWIDRVFTNFS